MAKISIQKNRDGDHSVDALGAHHGIARQGELINLEGRIFKDSFEGFAGADGPEIQIEPITLAAHMLKVRIGLADQLNVCRCGIFRHNMPLLLSFDVSLIVFHGKIT